MLEWPLRIWRAFATGFCFAVFGLGQLLIGCVLFPLVLLVVREPQKRERIGKRLMQLSFRIFTELMRFRGVLTYRVEHLARLERGGLLVVANHPTLIDVVFLISFLGRANCIVKESLLRNPFTRFAIRAAGLIPASPGGIALIERCTRAVNEGDSLIIFPEGTRSEPDRLLPFARGASQIALRARKSLTPVVIRAGEHNLGRHDHWWAPPRRRVTLQFEVKEDIPIEPLLESGAALPIAARALTDQLRRFFTQELESPCKPMLPSKTN